MTRAKLYRRDERGETSMVTVGMFMMLFSIIVVSFTYMAINAARVTTNDTLQSTAKSAAESGVEDAKRLLIYCYSNYTGGNKQSFDSYSTPTAGRICSKVIGHTVDDSAFDCNAILKASRDNSTASPLNNIEKDGDDYRTSVGETAVGDGTNREYYQCLKIGTLSKNYIGVANEGESLVIPLYLTDVKGARQPVTSITVKWHKNAVAEGEGPASGITDADGLPNKNIWNKDSNRPAVMRAEVLFVPNGNTDVNTLIVNDYALTMRPATSGGNNFNMNSYPSNAGGRETPNVQNVPFSKVTCQNGSSSDYACTATLNVSDISSSRSTDNLGYLRLLTTYKSAHVEVTAKNGGSDLYFDGIQPVVDVTGRSSDAFARIEARLKPQSKDNSSASSWFPEYAVQTDGKVCKQLNVFWNDGEDNCNY